MGRVDAAARLARQRLESLRRLMERGGERPQVLNDYARDLLTIEARDLRDPAAALPLAERACALAEERGTYGRWTYVTHWRWPSIAPATRPRRLTHRDGRWV